MAYTPFIERNIGKLADAINESQQKKLAQGAYMGDQNAMSELAASNPQLAQQIQQGKMRDQQMKLQQAGIEKQAKEGIAANIAKFDDFEQAKAYAQQAAQEAGIEAPPLDQSNFDRFKKIYGQPNGGVRSSQILDDGTTIQVMSGGETRVVDPGGSVLQGKARADAVRAAQDYGVDIQSRRAGGREQSVSDVKLDMNPQIAGAVEKSQTQTKQSLDLAEKYYGKIAPINNYIANFDDAIRLIDSGAATGKIESLLPSFRQSSIELDNVRRNLGLNVVGNTTFGALSKGELDLALDVGLPTGLEGNELKQWITNKKSAQVKMRDYLESAISYLGEGHSIAELSKVQKENRESDRKTEATQKSFIGADAQAYEWATDPANAQDPRAAAILQKLGVK